MENTNYPLQEKIKSYINDEIDEATRQELLAEANKSAEVADELAFSKSLSMALKNQDLVAAKAMLGNIISEEGFPPPSNTPTAVAAEGRLWLWFFAGALSLLFVWGGYQWAGQQGYFLSTHQKISKNYIQALENVLFLPNSGIGLSDLQAGMKAYDAGRYQDAAQKLEVYLRDQPDNAVKVYLGVSYLMADQPQAAIQPLVDAVQSQEMPVQEAASWYLALAQLQNNNPDVAMSLLDGLQKGGGVFASQSKSLMAALKKQ